MLWLCLHYNIIALNVHPPPPFSETLKQNGAVKQLNYDSDRGITFRETANK